MNLDLKGQTAVIVGGARGIGLAIAKEFACEGANVVLIDREKVAVQAADLLTTEFGVHALPHVNDVTNFDAVKKSASSIDRVDHLVYAVGIGSGKFGFPFWN